MWITSKVKNTADSHESWIGAEGALRPFPIPAKASGRGSAVSGGELLMLALATCYCNDLFREAGLRGIEIEEVDIEARGNFEAAGMPATTIEYRARVIASGSDEEVQDLIRHTDSVAEVHLTIRRGLAVTRVG